MSSSHAAEQLKKLIESVLAQKMEVDSFCEDFERIYNFELEVVGLSEKEQRVFEMLFNKVIYYSPFPEERKKIPNYLGEQEILESARAAWNEVKGSEPEVSPQKDDQKQQ